MDSISPLAKILAEANGIDWRSIPGSGDGGSVVEQDILNYLSRIMSGDEEPPATPVDEAPPGWTGEMPPMPSVAAGGLQALSAAGVESDITDFVAQQANVVQAAPAQHTPGLMGDVAQPAPLDAVQLTPAAEIHAPEFDASEFEIEEEPEHAAEGQATEFQSAEPQYIAAQHPEPMIGAQPVYTETAYTEPVYTEPVYTEPVQADAALMDTAESDFELDDLDGPETLASSEEEPTPSDTAPFGTSVYAEAEQGEVGQEPAVHASMMSEAEAPQTEVQEAAVHEPALHEPVAAMSGALADASAVDAPHADAAQTDVAQTDVQGTSVAAQILNPEPAAAAGGFGLGGFLSRLYGGKAKQDQAHADAAAPEPVQPEPVQLEAAHAEQPTPQEPEPTIGTAHDLPVAEQPDPAEPVLGEPLISQAPPIPDTPVAAPLVADQWRDQETAPAQEAEPEVVAQPEQAAGHHPEQTAEQTDAHTTDVQPTDAQPAQIDYTQMDLGQPIALPEAHEHEDASSLGVAAGTLAVTGVAAAGVAAFAGQAPTAPDAPTAANAITLRLNVDLGVLETARAQLSEALFREVPLSLLVARAAARSLATLGLSGGLHGSGHVALANHAGQPLGADPSGDLRASLDNLKQVSDVQPALLVLDAAELGLDELHRGECSLSVGRMASGGSALSLRGDIDAARGAQFLHEVEGLLHTPIKLLF